MSILKARNKPPIISFGFSVTEKSVQVGVESAFVNLSTLYNVNFYEVTIDLIDGVNITKVNSNNFILDADVVGEYDIQVKVTNSVTGSVLLSNVIKLIVI